jgi:hypothetical protein
MFSDKDFLIVLFPVLMFILIGVGIGYCLAKFI